MKGIFQGNNLFGNITLTHTLAQTKFTIMKKILTLIIPVLILMVACNNKPSTETTTVITDSVIVKDSVTTTVVDTVVKETGDGNPGVAAKVFEDVSLTPVTGAKVIAVESGKTIETAYTADDGTYVLTKVVAGHTYTYTASKTGYTSLTKTALYDGATTLPLFGVVKK